MNIKRAKQELKDSIEAYLLKDAYGNYEIPSIRQRPLFLIGAPGIGKTQIMEQIAKECQVGLVSYTITHHTRQSAIGLPFISEKEYGGKKRAVTEYTMSEIVASIYEKMEQTGLKEGILFIDEINCVSETLAPAMLQFLQCKTFGNHAIPEGWIIVAAGNPPEYNKSVREFDVVTMDRLKKIQVEPDFEVWKEYAYQENIHPAILAYLNVKQAYFYQMETTVDGRRFATPRGWEDLSRMLTVYEKLGKAMDSQVVEQYIQHPRVAKDFANYLELYRKYETDYEMDRILTGTISEGILKKISHAPFDERLSVVSLLLAQCMKEFRAAAYKEQVTERLFTVLKELKKSLPETGSQTVELLAEACRALTEERERKKAAELLGREEAIVLQEVTGHLEEYQRQLEAESCQDGEAAFDFLRGCFAEVRGTYEQTFEKAGQTLEYAFDFMEAAFANSQEMAIFLTELNNSYPCIAFLKTYECPRYYQYNREILFEEKQEALLGRIEQMERK